MPKLSNQIDMLKTEITALDADTPRLNELKFEHTEKVSALRPQVRAGTTPMSKLITAEGESSAVSNMLAQHLEEIQQKREELTVLENDADTAAQYETIKAQTLLFHRHNDRIKDIMNEVESQLRLATARVEAHRVAGRQAEHRATSAAKKVVAKQMGLRVDDARTDLELVRIGDSAGRVLRRTVPERPIGDLNTWGYAAGVDIDTYELKEYRPTVLAGPGSRRFD